MCGVNGPCKGCQGGLVTWGSSMLTWDWTGRALMSRVSSKQSNIFFGSNRNKPKLNLFRLFIGLFRETKKLFFRFVLVFQTSIETTETNRIFSKQPK